MKKLLDIEGMYGKMNLVTRLTLFLKGRTMKTRKNLSHNHTLTGAATVSSYDGWRDTVSITIRDEHKEGTDEVSLELPNNVFESLVSKLNNIVEERKKTEEAEVE